MNSDNHMEMSIHGSAGVLAALFTAWMGHAIAGVQLSWAICASIGLIVMFSSYAYMLIRQQD